MYVDSHQHFWKLSRGDYSWMTPDMKKLYKDFFPSDLEPLIKEKNISKIKNEMMQYELIAEDLSGDTLFVEVSALKKMNLDKLKESILLQSEILDLIISIS